MRRGYLVPAGLGLFLLLARGCGAIAGSTPAGQPPLAALNDVTALRSQFNSDTSRTRVIILLSQSCPYCLKGARAIQRILDTHATKPLVVLTVWQPILPTDWGKPGTAALGRLPDARVRQYWDEGHVVARALERSFSGRYEPSCCFQNGIWWDLIAVFPPGAEWKDTLPAPILLDGTVDDASERFDALLAQPALPPVTLPASK